MMKIDDNGKVIIGLAEIIEATPADELDKIIDEFGFAKQIWQRVSDSLKNEYSAASFNPSIHKIREAVFSDERLVPYALVRVVADLVSRAKSAEKKAEAASSAYFRLMHEWYKETGNKPCPVKAPEWKNEYPQEGSVEKLLEQWLGEILDNADVRITQEGASG